VNLYSIVIKNMKQRTLATALTVFSITLGVSLAMGIIVLHDQVEESFNNPKIGWDVIVGPADVSDLQLVLSTTLNVQHTANRMPYSVYEDIVNDERVQFALPFCVAGAHEGFTVVATSPTFFEQYEYEPGARAFTADGEEIYVRGRTPKPARGEWFGETVGEAVVGAFAAKNAGLDELGATFTVDTGVTGADESRDAPAGRFKVVGVMRPTGTAIDKVIYISLGSLFADEAGSPSDPGAWELSAVGVRCVDDFQGLQFFWDVRNTSTSVQAVQPLQRLTMFFSTTLEHVLAAFMAIAFMVVLVSTIGIIVWIYNSMSERRQDIAIMRSLGASRWTIVLTILLECVTLLSIGALLGVPGGHLGVMVAAGFLQAQSGAIFDAWSPVVLDVLGRPVYAELALFFGMTILGAIVGILPAFKAYKTDVGNILRPPA